MKLASLNQEKNDWLAKLDEIENEDSEVKTFIRSGIPDLFECDLETQTAIVDLLIEKIIVDNNKLDILWRK